MDVLEELLRNWGNITIGEKPEFSALNIATQKRLLEVFNVGNSYFYIVNIKRSRSEYTGPIIKGIQGHKDPAERLGSLAKLIHEDDIPYYLDFETAIDRFLDGLNVADLFKYKMQYDFRTRKADGSYVRILHQYVIIRHDEEDKSVLLLIPTLRI